MENTHNLINNIKKTILITLDDIEKTLSIEFNDCSQNIVYKKNVGNFDNYCWNLINLNIKFIKLNKFIKIFESENNPTKIMIDALLHIKTHITKCLDIKKYVEPELILLYEQFEKFFDFYIKLADENNHKEFNNFYHFFKEIQSKFENSMTIIYNHSVIDKSKYYDIK